MRATTISTKQTDRIRVTMDRLFVVVVVLVFVVVIFPFLNHSSNKNKTFFFDLTIKNRSFHGNPLSMRDREYVPFLFNI